MTDCMLAPSFLPATAVLEMTYRCNHGCLFCSCPWYADNNDFDERPELSVEEWKSVIAKACEMGCCDIAFTGGEPLMKEGIEEIIEFAAELNVQRIETVDGQLESKTVPPKLYLLTNGKNMRDDILDLCARHDINLSMSLPGLTTFEHHTCAGVKPEHVLEWFRKANNKGIKTTVGITVTAKNIHELFETISAALLAGADTLLMNRFLPGGRGIQYEKELMLNQEQVLQMLEIAEDVLTEANRFGSVGTELPKCVIGDRKYERLHVGTRCSAGLDFFVVDPSGYIRACNHSPVRLEHFSEVEKLKDNPYWKKFILKDYLPSQCSGCDMMFDCDGGCREAAHICGGNVDSPDPLLAEA